MRPFAPPPPAPEPPAVDSPDALAGVVILALTADGAIDPRELELLRGLDAFERLGLPESVFLERARAALREQAGRFAGRAWLSLADTASIDEVLRPVVSRSHRLRVLRLVAGVIAADGQINGAERLLYEHLLMRWRIQRSEVTDAIRADPVRLARVPSTA